MAGLRRRIARRESQPDAGWSAPLTAAELQRALERKLGDYFGVRRKIVALDRRRDRQDDVGEHRRRQVVDVEQRQLRARIARHHQRRLEGLFGALREIGRTEDVADVHHASWPPG